MTRKYGDTGADPLALHYATTLVGARGVVARRRLVRGVWVYDVRLDGCADTAAACERLVSPTDDGGPLDAGARVLVGLFGDGSGVILGSFAQPSASMEEATIEEGEPNADRDRGVGGSDGSISKNGSAVIFSSDGDIILKPRRWLRVESEGVRMAAPDASDRPVAGTPFLDWAQGIERALAALDERLVRMSAEGSSPNHVHALQSTESLPASGEGMLSRNLHIPTGSGDVGGEGE